MMKFTSNGDTMTLGSNHMSHHLEGNNARGAFPHSSAAIGGDGDRHDIRHASSDISLLNHERYF